MGTILSAAERPRTPRWHASLAASKGLPLAFAAALLVLAALPSTSRGLDTAVWSGASPAPGAVVTVRPTAPFVTADDAAPIVSATVRLNGIPATWVAIEHAGHTAFDEETESYYWQVDDYTKARITGYFSASQTIPGINTIVTTVSSSLGTSTYTRTYQFGSAVLPPAISSVSPAAGAEIPASPASISAALSSSLSSFVATMTVDGVVVPTSYSAGTKTFSHVPVADLAPGTHKVTFTVRDSAGGTTATSWSFKVSPPMSDASDCTACHTTYPAAHSVPNCGYCHSRPYTVPGGNHGNEVPTAAGCGGDGLEQSTACHRLDHSSDSIWGIWGSGPFACADCHNASYPAVPRHGADVDDAHETTTQGCSGCHETSLIAEHAKYPTAASIKYQCKLCHGSGARAQAVAAVRAGNTACEACHSTTHDDLRPAHQPQLGATNVAISGVDFGSHQCAECHAEDNLLDVHVTTVADCVKCHPTPKNTLLPQWDKSCAQAGCHTGSTATMHTRIDSGHAIPAERVACLASGCHDTGAITPFENRSVAEIHSSASTTTASSEVRTSCQICHASGDPLTADCATAGCHPDRLADHGYDPAKHTATGTCVLECHAPIQGLREMKPVHDAATPPLTCSGCHPNPASSVAPWNKTCASCHPEEDLHPAAASSHVGTDTAYREVSFLGNGCTPDAGHTEMLSCHDISNVAQLHSEMDGSGCAVCHGAGKTASTECLDCHQPGENTEYTLPGAFASGLATSYPSGDESITPGWAYTTTPVGQSRYAVVDSPYPPADTAEYLTITSNTAGGVLFGFASPQIPDDAKIVSVMVYAKGKASIGNQRKMQGLFRIGGTNYQTGTQSAFLPSTGFLGGTGAGTGLTSSPNMGYDYTREPLYGEAIYGNPKTGQRWTPAQLNGTDPVNSLQAFGVALTSSAGANDVSLAQIYLRVSYYVQDDDIPAPTVGTGTYHHNNVKYLHDPADAEGKRFGVDPESGWNDALFTQDCVDFCHRGNAGPPTFSAAQGLWMWYSVAGDPVDPVIATRTLKLQSIVLPAEDPRLDFVTNYRFGSSATGYVEISTDGGNAWAPLTGTVGGTAASVLSSSSAGWVPATYDLSAYAGQTVALRFRYVSGTSTAEGWAFDSLMISGAGGPIFSDDAETLKPDWTSSWWTRSMGAFPRH